MATVSFVAISLALLGDIVTRMQTKNLNEKKLLNDARMSLSANVNDKLLVY